MGKPYWPPAAARLLVGGHGLAGRSLAGRSLAGQRLILRADGARFCVTRAGRNGIASCLAPRGLARGVIRPRYTVSHAGSPHAAPCAAAGSSLILAREVVGRQHGASRRQLLRALRRLSLSGISRRIVILRHRR